MILCTYYIQMQYFDFYLLWTPFYMHFYKMFIMLIYDLIINFHYIEWKCLNDFE